MLLKSLASLMLGFNIAIPGFTLYHFFENLIDGFPNKFEVIACKSGKTWYVAGINREAISKDIS